MGYDVRGTPTSLRLPPPGPLEPSRNHPDTSAPQLPPRAPERLIPEAWPGSGNHPFIGHDFPPLNKEAAIEHVGCHSFDGRKGCLPARPESRPEILPTSHYCGCLSECRRPYFLKSGPRSEIIPLSDIISLPSITRLPSSAWVVTRSPACGRDVYGGRGFASDNRDYVMIQRCRPTS